MSKQDGLIFGGAGLGAWLAVTLFYAAFAGEAPQSTWWSYAVNALLAAAFGAFVFQITTQWRHVRRGKRMLPMLAFITPGLMGGALVIGRFDRLMPFADAASLGRYGVFLAVLFTTLAASAFERSPQRA